MSVNLEVNSFVMRVSEMGFTAYQHKKAISHNIHYRTPVCISAHVGKFAIEYRRDGHIGPIKRH